MLVHTYVRPPLTDLHWMCFLLSDRFCLTGSIRCLSVFLSVQKLKLHFWFEVQSEAFFLFCWRSASCPVRLRVCSFQWRQVVFNRWRRLCLSVLSADLLRTQCRSWLSIKQTLHHREEKSTQEKLCVHRRSAEFKRRNTVKGFDSDEGAAGVQTLVSKCQLHILPVIRVLPLILNHFLTFLFFKHCFTTRAADFCVSALNSLLRFSWVHHSHNINILKETNIHLSPEVCPAGGAKKGYRMSLSHSDGAVWQSLLVVSTHIVSCLMPACTIRVTGRGQNNDFFKKTTRTQQTQTNNIYTYTTLCPFNIDRLHP